MSKKSKDNSGNGMITYVWGPAAWHYLHTVSFNYPVKPTQEQKSTYKDMILSFFKTLPCGACRCNIQDILKGYPLTDRALTSRNTLSRWMYHLHNKVSSRLQKENVLTYSEVKKRYESFRAKCNEPKEHKSKGVKRGKKSEVGCVNMVNKSLEKPKCVIKIIPKSRRATSITIDPKCVPMK